MVQAVLSPQGQTDGRGEVSLRAADIHVYHAFTHLSCRRFGQGAFPCPRLPTHDVVPPARAAAAAAAAAVAVS